MVLGSEFFTKCDYLRQSHLPTIFFPEEFAESQVVRGVLVSLPFRWLPDTGHRGVLPLVPRTNLFRPQVGHHFLRIGDRPRLSRHLLGS